MLYEVITQKSCYDATGTLRNCEGTGEDGESQKGVQIPSPRFTDNGDGTVTDNLTGLMWLQNVSFFGQQSWQQALDSIASFNIIV